MDEALLKVVEGIVEGRNDFFSGEHNENGVASSYLSNESIILSLVKFMLTRNTLLTITFPQLGQPVQDQEDVIVRPSQQQIDDALEPVDNVTSSCSICQEPVSSGGSRIRQCGHVHHRTCILCWLSMSTRCPVCRHDIREEGPEDQMPSASSQT